MRVSIVVLTHNEECNLPACLDSLVGFDDIYVLDSGSTDRTVAIARERGVAVHHNPFRGFGTQRNWAIDHIPTANDWHFHIDADERMTPELATELAAAVARNPAEGGYHVPSRMMFAGRWLRRAGQYPGYQVRFFHKARLRFADHGHGQREVTDAPVGFLRQPLIHYAFSKGLDAWFVKHVGYARREAERTAGGIGDGGRIFSTDAVQRRRGLKRLTGRLPGRYFLRLAYMLLVRRAIFDGWAGVTYSHMIATYEGMIDVYLRLLRRGIRPDDGL